MYVCIISGADPGLSLGGFLAEYTAPKLSIYKPERVLNSTFEGIAGRRFIIS